MQIINPLNHVTLSQAKDLYGQSDCALYSRCSEYALSSHIAAVERAGTEVAWSTLGYSPEDDSNFTLIRVAGARSKWLLYNENAFHAPTRAELLRLCLRLPIGHKFPLHQARKLNCWDLGNLVITYNCQIFERLDALEAAKC
jgi:hypothetical protein